MRKCDVCGKEFQPKTKINRFCCYDCQRVYHRALEKKRSMERVTPKRLICNRCGREFVTELRNRPFCDDCKGKAPMREVSCRWCGKTFLTRHSRTNCCGDESCIKARNEYKRNYSANAYHTQAKNERRKELKQIRKEKHKNTTKELIRIDKKAKKGGMTYGQAVAVSTLSESDKAFRQRLEEFKRGRRHDGAL